MACSGDFPAMFDYWKVNEPPVVLHHYSPFYSALFTIFFTIIHHYSPWFIIINNQKHHNQFTIIMIHHDERWVWKILNHPEPSWRTSTERLQRPRDRRPPQWSCPVVGNPTPRPGNDQQRWATVDGPAKSDKPPAWEGWKPINNGINGCLPSINWFDNDEMPIMVVIHNGWWWLVIYSGNFESNGAHKSSHRH
jgi:hypothetical protein